MTTPTLMHPDMQQAPVQQQPQQGGQQQFNQPVAQFNLLTSRNRRSDRAPHYFGAVRLNGVWYEVATWIQFSRNGGEQFLSNSITPSTAEQAARHEERERSFQSRTHGGQANGQAGGAGVPQAHQQGTAQYAAPNSMAEVSQNHEQNPKEIVVLDEAGNPIPVTDTRHPNYTPF
ncbi:hypothetical protein [Vibrio phage vB_VpaM_VPs20]|uniref:Uncharacterized protein n=1 Tax=Vibrio phage vB_VpaM_VPs20 TaxID=2978980 RepID=A0A9X9JR18_9CAUD|nr:hypothetical protein QNH06_gp03 [Vibrio phage vB_VpaM_VPs20]UYD72103.1 hypothetical protein [Vibrio phage vB_VpaM_VPs20]